MRKWHTQDGAADSAWVVQLVVVIAIVGLLGAEVFKLASAGLGADTDAGEVLEIAEASYDRDPRISTVRGDAQAAADERGITLVELTIEDQILEVTVQRASNTLFVHRIAGDAGWLTPAATRSTGVGP